MRIQRAHVVHRRAFVTATALTLLTCTVFNAKAIVSATVSKRGTIASKWSLKILDVSARSSKSTDIVAIDIVLEVTGTRDIDLGICTYAISIHVVLSVQWTHVFVTTLHTACTLAQVTLAICTAKSTKAARTTPVAFAFNSRLVHAVSIPTYSITIHIVIRVVRTVVVIQTQVVAVAVVVRILWACVLRKTHGVSVNIVV